MFKDKYMMILTLFYYSHLYLFIYECGIFKCSDEGFLSAQKFDSVGPYNFQCKVTVNLPPFAFTALVA
jgi:hypothetical protein